MNRILKLGMIVLFAVLLTACGNDTAKSDEKESKEKETVSVPKGKEYSNEELKVMFTTLTNSYITIFDTMSGMEETTLDNLSTIDNLSEITINVSSTIKIALQDDDSATSKDLKKYASDISKAATKVKDREFDDAEDSSYDIGVQTSAISNDYFDGYLPETTKKIMK